MKIIRVTFALAWFFLLMLASMACGNDGHQTAPGVGLPGGSLSQAGEEQLRQTVVQAQRTFLVGEAEEAYAFFTSDYQARCPFEQFSKGLKVAQAMYRSSQEPEITVEAIRLEGEKAFVDILVNGQDISAGAQPTAYPYFWVLEDGEWKRTNEDPAPCVFPTGTPVAPEE